MTHCIFSAHVVCFIVMNNNYNYSTLSSLKKCISINMRWSCEIISDKSAYQAAAFQLTQFPFATAYFNMLQLLQQYCYLDLPMLTYLKLIGCIVTLPMGRLMCVLMMVIETNLSHIATTTQIDAMTQALYFYFCCSPNDLISYYKKILSVYIQLEF